MMSISLTYDNPLGAALYARCCPHLAIYHWLAGLRGVATTTTTPPPLATHSALGVSTATLPSPVICGRDGKRSSVA